MIAALPRRPVYVVGGLAAAGALVIAVPLALAIGGAGARGRYQPIGASFGWEPLLLGLHLVTDLLIGLAYVGISGTLIVLARRARHSIPFLWVFVAFGLFIISCGLTHFMAALTLWAPLYWVAGGIKYVTALSSIGTALAIPPLIPKILLIIESTKMADDRRVQLEVILSSLDEGVVLHYADGRIGACNESAARILGLSTAQVLSRTSLDPAWQAVYEDGTPWAREDHPAMDALRTGRSSTGGIMGARTPGGEVTWLTVNARPLFRAGDERPYAVVATFADTTEARRAAAALRASEQAYRALSEELEARVVARTSELQAAVQELEAFSYSVSHDLRAPLRALHGFSHILAVEHAAGLAPEALRYLGLIEQEARRMGLLIDDLLRLSRLGRQVLERRLVRPAALAAQAMHDLRSETEGRQVEFTLGDLPPCSADAALLRQVFANLLANALKFTRPREIARIEVGSRREGGAQVYFVRDNGAGFDMRYAGKLFGAFQRLHRADQFEGTGVGLAIVQRIVHRHGGRVWAEGATDAGATFSFTLGEEQHDA